MSQKLYVNNIDRKLVDRWPIKSISLTKIDIYIRREGLTLVAESCHRVQEKDKMDPWRWSSARTGLIAWEDAILCIGRAVQADLAVTCPTRGGPRGEIMRRNMNKGAVEFFSKGKCRRCEPRRRGGGKKGGAVREPDRKNRC